MRNLTLYALQEDVKNPLHDKRCKYGFESVDKFRKGYKFVHDTANPKYDDGMPKECQSIEGKYIPFKIGNLLLAQSVNVQPQTFAEYRAVKDTTGIHISDDILEELWNHPGITVKHALANVMERLEGGYLK